MTPDFPRARVTIATEIDWQADAGAATRAGNGLLAAAKARGVAEPRLYRTDMPERASTTLVVEGTINLTGEAG